MTSVTVVRVPDRDDQVAALARAWDDGDPAWVLDPSTTATRLASAGGGVLDAGTIARVLAGALTHVDLPVPAHTATIVTSSGTTGAPKVVCLSAAALDASGAGAHAHLGVGADDRWGLVLPVHHVAGQSVLWRSRMLGVAPHVAAAPDAAAMDTAGVTVTSLVPTQLRRLVEAGDPLSLDVLLGGAAIAPGLLADGARLGARITRSYGLTETAGGCVYDGVPFPGTEVVARDGRLGIRGPTMATGLLGPGGMRPVTDDEGWLWTADLGSVHDGVVAVVGRADDIVITGGVNVNPASVEVVLEDHPAIARAGVVGVPDDEWGHRLVAVVELAPPGVGVGEAALDSHLEAELRQVVRDAVGPAAVPRTFLVTAHLPVTALGKVARARLPAIVGDTPA